MSHRQHSVELQPLRPVLTQRPVQAEDRTVDRRRKQPRRDVAASGIPSIAAPAKKPPAGHPTSAALHKQAVLFADRNLAADRRRAVGRRWVAVHRSVADRRRGVAQWVTVGQGWAAAQSQKVDRWRTVEPSVLLEALAAAL